MTALEVDSSFQSVFSIPRPYNVCHDLECKDVSCGMCCTAKELSAAYKIALPHFFESSLHLNIAIIIIIKSYMLFVIIFEIFGAVHIFCACVYFVHISLCSIPK